MRLFTYILAAITLLLGACEDQHYSTIPDVKFRTPPIYLDDPYFVKFDVGTSIPLDSIYGGYAGLILYKVAEGVIYAYDQCCPLHIEEKEQLILDGALAFCPTDSVYYPLLNGDPAIEMGNNTNPSILKNYKVSLNGNTLVVYN